MKDIHHFRILLHHDLKPCNRNVLGIPFDLNTNPTYDSYILSDDKLVGYAERARALNYYRVVHTAGTCTAISVSENF